MTRYYFSSGRASRRSKKPLGILFFSIAVGLFFGGIVWFRRQSELGLSDDENFSSPLLPLEKGEDEAPVRRGREEILLTDSSGGSQTVASREVQDRVFHHTVVGHLADPAPGFFYEGWLLRPAPFDFFSTGRMELNADGTYALVWDGERGENFWDYDQVVITLEPEDEDPGPAGHVLEGEFQN